MDSLKEAVSKRVARPSPYVTPIAQCFSDEEGCLCGEAGKLVLVY